LQSLLGFCGPYYYGYYGPSVGIFYGGYWGGSMATTVSAMAVRPWRLPSRTVSSSGIGSVSLGILFMVIVALQ
jgi:hypothetical protein